MLMNNGNPKSGFQIETARLEKTASFGAKKENIACLNLIDCHIVVRVLVWALAVQFHKLRLPAKALSTVGEQLILEGKIHFGVTDNQPKVGEFGQSGENGQLAQKIDKTDDKIFGIPLTSLSIGDHLFVLTVFIVILLTALLINKLLQQGHTLSSGEELILEGQANLQRANVHLQGGQVGHLQQGLGAHP